MSNWRVTGNAGFCEQTGHAVYHVTKGSGNLKRGDHDELEALLRDAQSGGWISVDDCLPDNPDQDVLCWNPKLGIRMGRRLGSMRPYIRPQGCLGFYETTTHWMPLPLPPSN